MSWKSWAGLLLVALLFLWAFGDTWRYYANQVNGRHSFGVGICEVALGPEWIDFPVGKDGDSVIVKWRPFVGPEEGRYIILISLTNPAAYRQFQNEAERWQLGEVRGFVSEHEKPKGKQLYIPECNALLVTPRLESYHDIQRIAHAR